MPQTAVQTATVPRHPQPKWLKSPVLFYEGKLAEIRKHIPDFERRAFGLTHPQGNLSSLNGQLDMVVRRPFGKDQNFLPVGVVSKDYTLVPHSSVLDAAATALEAAKLPSAELNAQLAITEYGERMSLSVFLPAKYHFDPGDDEPMALRLECVNSVDGSTNFRAFVGWFRFVCFNGLIIGVTRFEVRRRHKGDFGHWNVGEALSSGLRQSETDKRNFEQWRKTPMFADRLEPWIDGKLRKRWGFKAAARAYHIAQSGHDAEIDGEYTDNKPTTIRVRQAKHVPGAPAECRNLFDVSQILAWLAKERRDVQEQLEWRGQIPGLLKALGTIRL
jgi:Domain of unknown function (DUF932)